MLKQLAGISWVAIIAVAVAWPVAWLFIAAGTLLVAFGGAATSASGGIAAIGVSITRLAAFLLIAPPVALIILRAFAPYIGAD